MAGQVLTVAVGWQVYDIAGDPLALGLSGLAQFVPMAALTLHAGDLSDRVDRRLVLALSYAAQAIACAVLIAFALSEPKDVWPFYLVLAALGAARAYSGPAMHSFVPLLVPQPELPQAISLSSATFQVAVIAGPAIGGAVYAFGAPFAYALCLVLMLGVIVMMGFMRVSGSYKVPKNEMPGIARVTAGIAYVKRNPIVFGAISLDLFAVLLGGVTALLPIFARDILHVGPEGLGLLRSAPAVGAAALALYLSRWPLRRHAGLAMFANVALFGAATIVFGLSENFFLSLFALFLLGAGDMVSVYVRATLIQLATPEAMRGRVSAVSLLFIGASNELGEFESGVTASWFGTVPSVIIGGLGTLAVVGLWMWLFPALRRVDALGEVKPVTAGT